MCILCVCFARYSVESHACGRLPTCTDFAYTLTLANTRRVAVEDDGKSDSEDEAVDGPMEEVVENDYEEKRQAVQQKQMEEDHQQRQQQQQRMVAEEEQTQRAALQEEEEERRKASMARRVEEQRELDEMRARRERSVGMSSFFRNK